MKFEAKVLKTGTLVDVVHMDYGEFRAKVLKLGLYENYVNSQ